MERVAVAVPSTRLVVSLQGLTEAVYLGLLRKTEPERSGQTLRLTVGLVEHLAKALMSVQVLAAVDMFCLPTAQRNRRMK
jgi:hypothetical protein